jgi:hypothetical protein
MRGSGGWMTATETAAVAAAVALLISLVYYKGFKPSETLTVIGASIRNAGKIMIIIATALAFGHWVTGSGIPAALVQFSLVNEPVTIGIKHGKGRITVKPAPSGRGQALSVCNGGSSLPKGFDPTACWGLGMNLVSSLWRKSAGMCGSTAVTITTARGRLCSNDRPAGAGMPRSGRSRRSRRQLLH